MDFPSIYLYLNIIYQYFFPWAHTPHVCRSYIFFFAMLKRTRRSFLYKKIKMVQVTTPLLKFVAELVLNRSQRLIFDSSSPNGILLFREVSKLIVCYGSRVLALPNPVDIYASKYKGIWISFTILSRGMHFEQLHFLFFLLCFFI